MTIETNVNNSIESKFKIAKDVFSHTAADLKVGDTAKQMFSELNSVAVDIAVREHGIRRITYSFVAELVDAAHAISRVGPEKDAFDALCDLLYPSASDGNPFLPLVRFADGEWKTVKDKDGDETTKWVPNRSSEKYAAVCRFAVEHGFTGDILLNYFDSAEKLSYDVNGETKEIKATINNIIDADRECNPTKERKVLDDKDWERTKSLPSITAVPFTPVLKKLVQLDGDIGMVLVRKNGELLEIVGDAGRPKNEVQRLFKSRHQELAAKYRKATAPVTERADEVSTNVAA